MQQFWNKVIDLGATYGGKLLLAIVAALVGLLIIKLICKALKKVFSKSKLDEPVRTIIVKIIKVLLHIILVVAIIEILGVPMTSVAALIASAGLAVGLAFQGALANLAGGLMIIIFRPFKLGDYVTASGAEGTVTDISIFYTKLLTLDNKQILVPNGDLMNSNVVNFTAEEKRRVDISFKITNDIEIETVKAVLVNAAADTEDVINEPAVPFARVTAVDDDTLLFTVRAWCVTANYWKVYYDLIENCSKALRENGIDDPEERIAVRLVKPEE